MIDQRFLDDLAQDFKVPPEEMEPEVQLASANTGVTTDGYQPPLYRLNMPKGLNTRQNMDKQSTLLADSLAGGGKGMVQGFVGLPGDLESIGRMALNYLGYPVDENTALPTSEDIGKKLESLLGPVIPPNQTSGVSTAERESVAKGAEFGGEIIGPGGQLTLLNKVAKPVLGATKKIVEMGKDLPVGMGIKAVDESLDPLGFYSAASKAVDNIQQPKGTGAQFLAQIEKTPGVKKEELLWTGLDEFLLGKKSVTKAEVQDYLNTNRVEVKETTLKEYPEGRAYSADGNAEDGYFVYDPDGSREVAGPFNDIFEAESQAERMTVREMDAGPKFAKYTLPGGKNYREVLLTLPFKEPAMPKGYQVSNVEYDDGTMRFFAETPTTRSSAYKTEAEANAELQRITEGLKGFRENLTSFKSQHFDQPNVLAHMRLNDRVDADGKKVLFVEEVQSDWHQAGRKKGYAQPDLKPEDVRAEFIPPNVPEGANPDNYPGYYEVFNKKTGELVTRAGGRLSPERAIQEAIGIANATKSGVPDAPFKTSWHELSLKRAIQLASEGGYDRIAFTTGKTQADRYDLSKQISRVTYKDEILRAYDKDGVEVISNLATPDKLEDYVGKELASKIIADNDKLRIANKNYRDAIKNDVPDAELSNLSREVGSFPMEYKGVDLAVGGEGMKGFYDTILPKYLDKYGKKWDAKVGMGEITVGKGKPTQYADFDEYSKAPSQSAASVHYMDITPKMRESVLTKGQPLFQVAPPVAAGSVATQQEEKPKEQRIRYDNYGRRVQ